MDFHELHWNFYKCIFYRWFDSITQMSLMLPLKGRELITRTSLNPQMDCSRIFQYSQDLSESAGTLCVGLL